MSSLQGLVDELNHQVSQQAQSQIGNVKLAFYGHIWTYNPATHSVTVVMPSYRDQNNNPIMTPEIPLASQWVGNNYGIQIAPHGGATTGSTATSAYLTGEQCLVLVLERDESVFVCAMLFYTNTMPPPGAFTTLNPGEMLFKHESGSFLKFLQDGSMSLTQATSATSGVYMTFNADTSFIIKQPTTGAQIYISSSGAISITSASGQNVSFLGEGNLNIQSLGTITIQPGSGNVIVGNGHPVVLG